MHHDGSLTKEQTDTQDYDYLTGKKPCRADMFRGEDLQDPAAKMSTLQMLARLSANLERKGDARVVDLNNPHIPAGYTYFGQLIAHDLTFEPSRLPRRRQSLSRLQNLNTGILDLDCIYGGGSDKSPFLYEQSGPPVMRAARDKLRLGLTRGRAATADDLPRFRAFPPHGTVADAPAQISQLNDSGRDEWYETLIADPRNEDNLILSQLVVLFHKLHNKIVDGIRQRDNLAYNVSAFPLARELVTAIYRSVIEHDYLRVLMEPTIWHHYNAIEDQNGFDFFGRSSHEPPPIPIEFAVAAKRIGHAMINLRYDFNGEFNFAEGEPLRVGELVASGPDGLDAHRFVPLPHKWRIEWPRFFPQMEVTADGTYRPRSTGSTPSRLLRALSTCGLRARTELTDEDLDGTTEETAPGLIYHDLARSFLLELPNGQRMARLFRIDEQLKLKAHEITQCLEAERRRPSNPHSKLSGPLSKKDIDILANDTPLLLYILLEAELRQEGRRLGELGSRLIGEVMFGLLRRTDKGLSAKTQTHSDALFPSGLPTTLHEIHTFAAPA